MALSFLTKDNFKDRWDDSKGYMSSLHSPLSEYERISRNRPVSNINSAYPRVTDGTLASIIQEFPKRIIQQIPTGMVIGLVSDAKLIIANFVLNKEILPNANAQADILQKSWAIVGKSLTFGSYYSMTFFGKNNDYIGADFRLPYIKDVYFETGKLTFYDCNYVFIRAWYQKSDIEAIIERVKGSGKQDESGWNLAELKRLVDYVTEKEDAAKSAGESERGVRTEGIEVVHGFQMGVNAKFLSYAIGTSAFVREVTNKDKRGMMPIQAMYANIDLENPLGKGIVEMSGGTQNVIDSMLQTYMYNRALMQAPPLVKRGSWNKTQAKLEPNVIIDMGSDPNNSLETLKLDTTALNNFSNDYGLFKSQILALNNNGDTSISAETGNPGFSKTSQGVQAQQLKLGISDNYMRKQYERWFSDTCESLLNIHFANKVGTEELQLDSETAQKIRDIDPTLVSDDDIYIINYDDYTEKLKFEVDASTSDKASAQAQLEGLDSFLERIQNSPLLSALMERYPEKAVQLFNQYVNLTGVEDQEKLRIDVDQFKDDIQKEQEAAQMAQQTQAAGMEQPTEGQEPLPESQEMLPDGSQPQETEVVPQDQIPQDAQQVEPEMSDMGELEQQEPQEEPQDEEEIELMNELMQRGYDDDTIAQAVTMLREGVPEDEIADVLAQAGGQNG